MFDYISEHYGPANLTHKINHRKQAERASGTNAVGESWALETTHPLFSLTIGKRELVEML